MIHVFSRPINEKKMEKTMLKSHEKFHSANGKRLILVADDELINRELLGMILEDDYEVIYAADGQETIDQVRKYSDVLSLVLLDLMMPVKPGLEVLREMKADSDLKRIPVMVITADQDAEVESLQIGAIDYIPKPYPQADIILARILRAIELSEDRDIIQSTERDPLTGLYNREYFYRYAEQYDQYHKDVPMDAIVVNINHFHMINERFGTAYGDEVLRSIGEKIRESVMDIDGIVCRREADTFLAYCPHGKDYKAILDNASLALETEESAKIRLRLGVYADVDKTMDVERRFDRAKMAADTVRNNYTNPIGIYDDTMHEREIYAEQLIDDFHKAIEQKQFKIHYQPKFDIRPKTPVLSSLEALVRWQHPDLGMISPGVFISLFEDNGLIQELDNYVWKETASQIREWREKLGFAVPVSVNVSRIDVLDPHLFDKFEQIMTENQLDHSDLLLEITESAYTEDSERIIETVNQLREVGFRIEMDDFGTGYSSLNMISSLPLDALKLDMQFLRSAFKDQKDTRMLEVIIDISDHLGVPVIAEGVETEEQLLALKDIGCDIVQGYYFSKPVPAEEIEPFLITRKDLRPEDLEPEVIEEEIPEEPQQVEILQEPEQPRQKKAVQLRAINYIFVILAFVLTILLFLSDYLIDNSHTKMDEANTRYHSAEASAGDLEAGSDYLTVNVRSFVVTGDLDHLEKYFEEVNVTKRRDQALNNLEVLLEGNDNEAYMSLQQGLELSNELMDLEYHAMRLTQISNGYADTMVPEEVSTYPLSAEERDLSREDLKKKAQALVFGDDYSEHKDQIRACVTQCTEQLINNSGQELVAVRDKMDRLMGLQTGLLIALMLVVLGEVIFVTTQIRIPLSRLVDHMQSQKKVPEAGAQELRYVSRTYNEILEQSQKAHKELTYEASHDPLTGLLNRSGYEMFMDNVDKDHIGLLIIDVDKFKTINDTHGHDVGDKILQWVAEILEQSFRSVDAVCRVGGDEFVVVMTRAGSSMRQLVINKIARANAQLQNPKNGLPKASLSVGVAFSDRKNPQGDIFKDADTALYQVKNGGRCGCAVYGAEEEEEEN